ncbi:citrate lyase holo-[acyl-carrier protein] synthase [Acidaminobacter sp. JC074]|uniref:citrate lyase holo-[acyl-carrier protein] synthase n=1 Tax=Acidaminobacter sp. JC074 TaxID=2530199 RepID=UPI001F0EEE56|nr:citrate lyase holo-[acyl-carrier protein] synthase [Acidaminobacter sp. JC074]MCH4890684.1 citrate lyase holo-[acyl-carrier protein] synthase [Acidaminobacter sp. JC074]
MNWCTLDEILESRDKRNAMRKILISRYGQCLVSFHLNIPGPVKDKLLYKISLIEGQKALINYLKKRCVRVVYDFIEFPKTGPEGVLIVKEKPMTLKNLLVDFESLHPLGRVFDLDVYTEKGLVSREDLKLEARRCYVCDDFAKVCARSKHHDINLIIQTIDEMMKQFHNNESQREI